MKQRSEYIWQSFGDKKNPLIAMIAPSNGRNQRAIKQRIDLLVKNGLYVKVAKYPNGNLVIESDPDSSKSNIPGSFLRAVSPQIGAMQIIDCILAGWNILPYMGGAGFENKLPLIIKYFDQNPKQKNLDVKIFGVSNATFAAFLQAKGICTFICSAFASCLQAKENDNNYDLPAQELLKILKNQSDDLEIYPRKILSNPHNQLQKITKTKHYPLFIGALYCDIDQDSKLELAINDKNWSMAIEGFAQNFDGSEIIDYGDLLEKFLIKHQNNLPQFIEIGSFATRIDGNKGYQSLLYDDNNLIIIDDYNINKILASKMALNADIKRICDLQKRPDLGQFSDKLLTKEDVIKILQLENQISENIKKDIIKIANNFNIAVILNNRFGHSANMAVVNGGDNICYVEGGNFFITYNQ